MGASGAIYALHLKIFNKKKPCSRVSSKKCWFYS